MDYESAPPPAAYRLAMTLFVLVILASCLAGILYLLRRQRRAQKQPVLPTHHRCPSQRRLTISATSGFGRAESIYVVDEKRDMMQEPTSPVPEIRITFPDEADASGKRQSGRVVVLRIADSGSIGMEPVAEDQLPPYQKSDAERFQSLDLDRIGGLKEKEAQRWS